MKEAENYPEEKTSSPQPPQPKLSKLASLKSYLVASKCTMIGLLVGFHQYGNIDPRDLDIKFITFIKNSPQNHFLTIDRAAQEFRRFGLPCLGVHLTKTFQNRSELADFLNQLYLDYSTGYKDIDKGLVAYVRAPALQANQAEYVDCLCKIENSPYEVFKCMLSYFTNINKNYLKENRLQELQCFRKELGEHCLAQKSTLYQDSYFTLLGLLIARYMMQFGQPDVGSRDLKSLHYKILSEAMHCAEKCAYIQERDFQNAQLKKSDQLRKIAAHISFFPRRRQEPAASEQQDQPRRTVKIILCVAMPGLRKGKLLREYLRFLHFNDFDCFYVNAYDHAFFFQENAYMENMLSDFAGFDQESSARMESEFRQSVVELMSKLRLKSYRNMAIVVNKCFDYKPLDEFMAAVREPAVNSNMFVEFYVLYFRCRMPFEIKNFQFSYCLRILLTVFYRMFVRDEEKSDQKAQQLVYILKYFFQFEKKKFKQTVFPCRAFDVFVDENGFFNRSETRKAFNVRIGQTIHNLHLFFQKQENM